MNKIQVELKCEAVKEINSSEEEKLKNQLLNFFGESQTEIKGIYKMCDQCSRRDLYLNQDYTIKCEFCGKLFDFCDDCKSCNVLCKCPEKYGCSLEDS